MKFIGGKKALAFLISAILATAMIPTISYAASDKAKEESKTESINQISESTSKDYSDEKSISEEATNPEYILEDTDGDELASQYFDQDTGAFASFSESGSIDLRAGKNAVSVKGKIAGRTIKYKVTGINADKYYNSAYYNLPAVGTLAYVPYSASSSYSGSSTIYLSDYAPNYEYSRDIYKAGKLTEKITYYVYKVKKDAWGDRYWSYTKVYTKIKKYTLKGQVYFNAYPAKSVTKYSSIGTKIFSKNYVPKKAGWKFLGWYNKQVGGKKYAKNYKLSYGGGYYKTVYAHWEKNIKVRFDPGTGRLNGPSTKTVKYLGKYGKMPTASKSGWHFLGWYKVSKYGLGSAEYYNTDRVYDTKTVVFKARYVAKGKNSSLTYSEWYRFKENRQYGLTYDDVKAIIGGSGYYQGYYHGYSYGPSYTWYGLSSYGHYGYNKVTLSFYTGSGRWSQGTACSPFYW